MKKLLLLALALTITACSSTAPKSRTIANDPCSENFYTDSEVYFDMLEKCRGR